MAIFGDKREMTKEKLKEEMDKALNEIIDVPKIMNFQMDLIEQAFKKGLSLGIKIGKEIISQPKE